MTDRYGCQTVGGKVVLFEHDEAGARSWAAEMNQRAIGDAWFVFVY